MAELDPQTLDLRKRGAAALSFAYNVTLTVAKVVAAVLTGSVSLLSESVHSATDVVASGIALVSVRAASAPPDEEHPYGHGKIESLAGFGESILLLCIVVYIFFESIVRLFRHEPVANLGVGFWVMGFSATSAFVIGKRISRIGEETQSVALRSNGQHIMVDFWTSAGVLVALAVSKLTGWPWVDSVFAMLLGLWIARGAWAMLHEAFDQLIDRNLPDGELRKIDEILCEEPGVISYHKLRTRHSGHVHYVDVHVVVPNDWTVIQGHDVADRLERRIKQALAPAHAIIHVEPYDVAKACAQHK